MVHLPSDWLERPSEEGRGDHLHKAQAEESLWLCWFIVFFCCFIAWYSIEVISVFVFSPGPVWYISYFYGMI